MPCWQYLQIVGTEGWIDVRNEYREFEMWRRWPIDETREMTSVYNHPLVVPPARVQFPNPRVPQSSQTASIDTLVENHEQGTPCNCPGEWALECMEMEIGLRESAAQNGVNCASPCRIGASLCGAPTHRAISRKRMSG